MEDIDLLLRRIDALESAVNSLAASVVENPNADQAMVGNGVQVMPVLSGSDMAPWTFSCEIDPDNGVRTGGWYRQIVQIGMHVHNYEDPSVGFADETNCLDGDYYLKVDLGENEVEIVRIDADAQPTFEDIPNGILAVYIGTVENGEQTNGIYWAPVVYINL